MNVNQPDYDTAPATTSHIYALMLKLRPRAAGEMWPNAGQLAHGALLAWLGEVDPTLATRLHEPNQDRPFTCSSLWFPDERAVARAQRENRRLPVHPAQVYWLRLTLLQDDLFRTLTARFLRPTATPTPTGELGLPTLRLGDVTFDVAELIAVAPDAGEGAPQDTDSPTTWAGYSTFAALVEQARALDPASFTARSVGLEFRSPTAFSDGQRAWGKRMHLFPDPDRLFDRLARVWNAWAPPDFALDVQAIQAYAREWVAVAQYDLGVRTLHFDRHAQVGFVGRCTYALMDAGRAADRRAKSRSSAPSEPADDAFAHTDTAPAPPPSLPPPPTVGADLTPLQALHLLAAFAFYAGVGQKTAMGMGQARPLPPPTARPRVALPPRSSVGTATTHPHTEMATHARDADIHNPSSAGGGAASARQTDEHEAADVMSTHG